MTIMEAYHKLFSLSSGQWVKIPEDIRQALKFPHGLGMMGGVICTRVSAEGITRLVNLLNSHSLEGSK